MTLNPLLRVLAFWFSFMILIFICGSALGFFLPANMLQIGNGILGSLVAIFCTWFWSGRRWKVLNSYGLLWQKGSLRKLVLGLLIGATLIALMLAALIYFTPLHLTPKSITLNPSVIFWILSVVMLALMEEIAFRGLPLVDLQEKYGLFIAQMIVGIAFAVYHIIYGWSVWIAFMGPFTWAFIFGLARVKTNGIALPTAIHIGLNAGQVIVGLRPDLYSAFELGVPGKITPDVQSQIDIAGVVLQILILLTGLILTYLYQRRRPNIAA